MTYKPAPNSSFKPTARETGQPMKGQTMTTQKEIRAAFWQAHPDADRRRYRYSWNSDDKTAPLVYCTDTRCAFVDFLDYLHRTGQISEALANRATL